jgi:hypothetical protein
MLDTTQNGKPGMSTTRDEKVTKVNDEKSMVTFDV